MAEQDRAEAPDTDRDEPGSAAHAEGWVGAEANAFNSGEVIAGSGPQSIESTTAALGDMEPSAGSVERGAGQAETDGDKT